MTFNIEKPKMRLCQLACQKANGCDMKGCTPDFPVPERVTYTFPSTTNAQFSEFMNSNASVSMFEPFPNTKLTVEDNWTKRDDICEARWLRHIKGLE